VSATQTQYSILTTGPLTIGKLSTRHQSPAVSCLLIVVSLEPDRKVLRKLQRILAGPCAVGLVSSKVMVSIPGFHDLLTLARPGDRAA